MPIRLPPRAARWCLVATVWVLLVATIGFWIAITDTTALRAQLVHLQFWTLELLFAFFAILTVAKTPSIWRLGVGRARKGPGTVCSLFATVTAVLVLVTMVAPKTNRIYYDEQIYQNIGQNMSDLRQAQMCNDGSLEYGRLQCRTGEYNKQPYGYPYLLSIAYRVVGTGEGVAHWVNGLTAALLVMVIFLTTSVLFRSTDAALFAALVMTLNPEYLRWAATAAAEPSATLFAAIAVMTAAYFVRTRTTSGLLWVVSASSLATQFRIESGLVLGVVALIVLTGAPDELRRPRTYLAAALALLLMTPLLGHFVAVTDDSWGAIGPRTSWSYVWPNLTVNGSFYLTDERFPTVYTLLAILGAIGAPRRSLAAVVISYFAAFFAAFLFFYAGSYNYGADVRFSLMTYPPLAILAGIGAAMVTTWSASTLGLSSTRTRAIVCAFILLQFSWHLPYLRAVGEEAWAARADVEFARAMAATVPDDGYVFSHNPNMFHVWGTSSAQTIIGVALSRDVTQLLERYRGGVYFHWGFWCNVNDEAQRDLCRQMTKLYNVEVIAEQRRWYHYYAFYRITGLRDNETTARFPSRTQPFEVTDEPRSIAPSQNK